MIVTVIHDIRGISAPRCVICRRGAVEIANEPERPCTFPNQPETVVRVGRGPAIVNRAPVRLPKASA